MSNVPDSILTGVNAVIDQHFFIGDQLKEYRYKHKRSCNLLSKTPPVLFDGLALITDIYDCIEGNLLQRPDRTPSTENWKLRPSDNPDRIKTNQNNQSDEVTLERAIVQQWPDEWTYQMPVASGIMGPIADKRRAIDLIYSNDNQHFDFVELKIRSDTPLYAAMEILGYGLIYLASRRDTEKKLKYNKNSLSVMTASKITLCVLAPKDYYKNCNLKWLQDAINKGLHDFVKNDLTMDFRFENLSEDFVWNHKMQVDELVENFGRERVYF